MGHDHHNEGEHQEAGGCHGGKHHGHMMHHLHMRKHLPFLMIGIFMMLCKIAKYMKERHDMKRRAMYTVRGGVMGAMAMAVIGTWKWICLQQKNR